MLNINTATTLAEAVDAFPQLAREFEVRGLDYCCGGQLSLEVACNKKHLNIADVEEALAQSALELNDAPSGDEPQNWPLDRLADHIVSKHHAFVAGYA